MMTTAVDTNTDTAVDPSADEAIAKMKQVFDHTVEKQQEITAESTEGKLRAAAAREKAM